MKKSALVLGAGGFIGNHLVHRLKDEGYWVRGVDLKRSEYSTTRADDFVLGDLRDPVVMAKIMSVPGTTTINSGDGFDEVYQLAADMGGAGYIFSGENDANVMHNSSLINLNVALEATKTNVKKLFYSSSACMYPAYNQEDPNNPKCSEESAYPANPDSEYGWEKLFSERLYLSFMRNYKLNVRIARFHNIYGPLGTWKDGKEKAPAALCRKVIECPENGSIEVWGDGSQTRSFLYIDECIEGVRRLMNSDFTGPVNIGSEEMLSINDFAKMIIGISGKNITVKNIPGFTGVRGRNSDNNLIRQQLGWAPGAPLKEGIMQTYKWIEQQVKNSKQVAKTV